jgi:hypothetical protein
MTCRHETVEPVYAYLHRGAPTAEPPPPVTGPWWRTAAARSPASAPPAVPGCRWSGVATNVSGTTVR